MRKFNGFKAFLLAFAVVALTGLAFGADKASAANQPDDVAYTAINWGSDALKSEIKYVADDDVLQITNSSVSPGAINYFVFKLAKEDDSKDVKGDSLTKVKISACTTPGAITLVKSDSVKKPTVSVSVDKDVLFAVGLADDINKKAKYTGVSYNIKVSANPVKKLVPTLSYTGVFADSEAKVLTGYYLDSDKKQVAVAAETLQYSMDGGKTWISNKGTDAVTGGAIYSATTVTDKKKVLKKLMVRVEGKDSTGANATGGVRPSKAANLSVKAPAKATDVKIDVKTSTIAIKNGFDYQVVATGAGIEGAGMCKDDGWKTIVPVFKDSTNENATIATQNFIPAKKPGRDADAAALASTAFTKTTVKSLNLNKLFAGLSSSKPEGYVIYSRKSATVAAPASQISVLYVPAVAAAPEVESKSSNAATCPAITFDTSNATASALEYCIIAKDEVDKVDPATIKWSKLDGKTKVATKPSSYSVMSDGALVKSEANRSKVATGDQLWVRYAGVAKKNSDRTTSYTLASEKSVFVITVIPGQDPKTEREITGYHAAKKQ